MRARTHTHTE